MAPTDLQAGGTAGADFRPSPHGGRSRAAVAGLFWSFLHSAVPTASAALVFFVGAYFLTPAEFGGFGLAAAIVMAAIALSPLGFGEALVQRETLDRRHADTVFALSIAYGLCLLALVCLAARPLGTLIGQPDLAPVLAVLALRIPLDLANAVPMALLTRAMQFRRVALRTGIATLAGSACALAMLIAGTGVWALAASQVISSLVALAVAVWASGYRPGRNLSLAALRELGRYGLFASGSGMLAGIRLDHILLGALGGAHMLGQFILAQRIYTMLAELASGTVAAVSHSLLASLQGEPGKMRRAFSLATFFAVSAGLPAFAGAALIVDDMILGLLDSDWAGTAFAAQVFCLAGFLASAGIVQGAMIRSQGHAGWWFGYQAVQNGTTLLAVLAAFPFGLDAVVITIVAKSYLVWPVSVVKTARILGVAPLTYLGEFAAPAAATLVMTACVMAVASGTAEWPVGWSIAAQVAAGAASYLTAMALLAAGRIRALRDTVRSERQTA